jgi:hypothetical protein
MQYNFDLMSLNFGHHCGALELGFLDHTSFDVAETSSSQTNVYLDQGNDATDMTSDTISKDFYEYPVNKQSYRFLQNLNLNERIDATVSSESTSVVNAIDEGESTTAREHPLYQTDCTEEGLYICPVENCSHQSGKLKCNFE